MDITRQDLDDLRESLHGDIKALGVKVDAMSSDANRQQIDAAVAKVKSEAAEENLKALISGVNKDRDDMRDWKRDEHYAFKEAIKKQVDGLEEEFRLSKWKILAVIAGSGTLGGMAGKLVTALMGLGG